MSDMNQEEPSLPLDNNSTRSSVDLLPKYFRTSGNKKFLQATLDQLTQPGSVKKVNGYIGRQNAKAVKSDDIFVEASDKTRQDYQLEPTAIIQDDFENVTFFKDYIDHINQIKVFGGIVDNHEKLNKQESYSWNPYIDWDKFVNFQNYYWLPYGPDSVTIYGQQEEVISTYSIALVDEGDNYAFLFSPDALTRNPTLRLYRGQTYYFQVNSPNNPFSIKTSRTTGDVDRYTKGVTNNNIQNGVITFTIPDDAPDVLFYVSETDLNAGGVFHILGIEENTFLDLDKDLLGKKTYTSANNIQISNGMKIRFEGRLNPESYGLGSYYVEGVGTGIKLIPESELEIISTYTDSKELLFDDTGFDLDPFSTASAFPSNKDYITISRGALDRNPWSRYNRWVHQNVIETTAIANGKVPVFDQDARAKRPIIEFKSDLKLYNFGHKAKQNVDVIDSYTKDVFSTIEGSLGYNIDGVDLTDGMRVLFVADQDRLVKNKIFKVNFINVIVPARQISFNAKTQVNKDTDEFTFNSPHALITGDKVIYLNNGNTSINGLENRQIYYVFVIDTLTIKLYADKMLTVPVDIFNIGNDIGENIHKFEIYIGQRRQINLTEESDTDPLTNETVLINQGVNNQGYMYWFDGSEWKFGQQKINLSQPPLFDIFDENGISYGDTTVYDSNTFKGNKLFSYKIAETGLVDPALNFRLSYKNINNVGDIVFEFNLLNDSFEYKVSTDVKTKNTDIGYLKKINSLTEFDYVNGWTKTEVSNLQPVVRIFKNSGLVNDFPIDVYDDQSNLNDLTIKVYVNGTRVDVSLFEIQEDVVRKFLHLTNDVLLTDVVTLKCFSKQKKNQNGHYDVPLNLQNNPLNDNLNEFTLGEVIDHVNSIIENVTEFSGSYPGSSNLRDLGEVAAYGTRFLQHAGPLNLALYHFGQKNFNVFKALEQARNDYGKFKRSFIVAASNTGMEMDTKFHVDYVLEQMNKDHPKNNPYYLSDMFAYSATSKLEYIIEDARIKIYPISQAFNLKAMSNKAVYVYLNGEHLINGRDYIFGDNVFVEILTTLEVDDVLEFYEYETTDGAFCPSTPTKLGLYPKYEPSKYIDDTYLTPTEVIQGHDGSITLAFGDYRDDMILELEKRIYNNIKTEYDSSIFDIYDFIPGNSRETEYTKEEFEQVLSKFFYQWTTLINEDYTQQTYWDRLEPFTFNYRDNYTPEGKNIPAFWRGVYDWLLDTDRPHTHPWECLGFTVKPSWWEETYGPTPYTSDNRILWDDIRQGLIRIPNRPVVKIEKFAKSILQNGYPVDNQGNLVSPLLANYAQGPLKATAEGYYVFGDQGPVETAWRRSSFFAFSLIQTLLLLQPNKVLSTCFDRSRSVRNLTGQLVYSNTNLRIRLKDIVIPSTTKSVNRIYSSGLVNYIVDYVNTDITTLLDNYINDLGRLTNKIGSKLGSFTTKNKFRLLLDSKSPTSTGGVFVPEENYSIFLNTSSATKKVVYSGVIITKYPDGFEIRGYDLDNPYFIYYPFRLNSSVIRVGGISETFTEWSENKTYVSGKVVYYGGRYYRVKTNHNSGDTFSDDFYARLADLPQVGGVEAIIRKGWDYNNPQTLAYGTKYTTIQEVADFIQGYGEHLVNQGFVFDTYNSELKAVTNWKTSLREFLFWTTQNWKEGSVLALSPAAQNLVFRSDLEVVNDIRDPFYGYKIYRVDGQLLEPAFTNSLRQDNEFNISIENTNHGIYGAVLYTVQKEHALIIDNITLFNDVIYDLAPGYRQERIKTLGYVSSKWNGSFNIPGFVFDQAKISNWGIWTDYDLGDIVKYKEFYYSAKKFLPGVEKFDFDDWYRLEEKPTSRMLPNWDYKAEQFTDFYDLDTDNFDSEQQRLAQHLIGYQKRQYLENIIKDDVSQYKFYQGMIVEKGTKNVFSKLFDTLSADDQDSLILNEEWALRVGDFGASSAFEEIELKLDEKLFKLTPQPFELLANNNTNLFDYVIRQEPGDIYVKPVGYNNNPWPLGNVKQYLRSCGFVRYDDVQLAIDNIDELLNVDVNQFIEGDYIWCAFDTSANNYWNVYRLTKTSISVEDVSYADGQISIVCERIPKIVQGQIIGINQTKDLDGFYKVIEIQGRTIKINKEITEGEYQFSDSTPVLIYKLTSNKIDSINFANDYLPEEIKSGELIWVNDIGNNIAGTYENQKVFERLILETPEKKTNLKYGLKVSMSKDGTLAAVTTNDNRVFILNKSSSEKRWINTDILSPSRNIASTTNIGFGLETAFSPDGEWLAVAAPTASFVKSGYSGEFSGGTAYQFADVVRVKNTHWYAKAFIAGDSSADTFDNDPTSPTYGQKIYDEFRFRRDWTPAYLLNTDFSKPASSLAQQGYVNIYKKYSESKYALVHSFISPYPSANERFGETMSFAKQGDGYVLAISAPGFELDTARQKSRGRVYMFRYGATETDSTVSLWRMDYNRYYVGSFSSDNQYYPGDIVLNPEDYQLYRCLAFQDPTPIATNPSAWQLITNTTSVLGFFPQIVDDGIENVNTDGFDSSYKFPSPLRDETVEMVFAGDEFGYDVKLNAFDGNTLIISAPSADDSNYGNFKGRFKKTIIYFKGDIVFHLGGFWRYLGIDTDTAESSFVAADWEMLNIPNYNYKGAFNSSASYQSGDVVYYSVSGKATLYQNISQYLGDGSSGTDISQSHEWVKLFPRTPNTGKVFVYKFDGEGYQLVQTLGYSEELLVNKGEKFGESIAITDDGKYIAVGSTLTDRITTDQGKVVVFKKEGSLFYKQQDLYGQDPEPRQKFGHFVEFMNNGQTLAVFSANGDIENQTTFDNTKTTFDDATCRIVDVQLDTGRVDIFDKYDINYVFGESLSTPFFDEDSTRNDISDKYGYSIAVANNNILISAPYEDGEKQNVGKIWSYAKPVGAFSWNLIYSEKPAPDANKIKKAYLYNRIDNKLLTYLDVVDPIQGKIPGIADQEIKFKTYFDPAIYTVGTDSVNVDQGLNWTDKNVGMLWWDLTRAKFLEFSVGEIVYRSSNWNRLYKTASIDVYEWVSTKYLPSEWDSLSGTEEGFSLGISGISKYSDSNYSVKRKYDSASQAFVNTYFYWVKNPSLLPNIEGRFLPASDVANLITDPVGYGYPCIALTGSNSFNLANVQNLLEDDRVVVNVQYWLIDNLTQNVHSEWKIISEDESTVIPREIEIKWLDSLLGKDYQNRILPDRKLPFKLRYGIESRPRQSMFTNRVEALKQFIERTNSVLSKLLIVDDADLTDLTQAEPIPNKILGQWDTQLETEEELRFIGTISLRTAKINPIIVDGRITNIEITDHGSGYINAPTLKVVGSGKHALLKTTIDVFGKVVSVDIENPGYGYNNSTYIEVRPYSVLINNDSDSLEKWAIYHWNTKKNLWDKVRTQSFDVNLYWDYIDWYTDGYNQFTAIDYVVDNTYQLAKLESDIGSIVKVKNIGSGGWVLLEKYNNKITIDYTENYRVVARENGSIKFNSSLYNFKNTVFGYDGALYDSTLYDNFAERELKIILYTIRDKIFVEGLRIEYIRLFFSSLRYVFTEQYFVDWAIKTSFVNATHNAGSLKQKVTYNSDNLQDFEKYVNEVKPYRTKVREYVSAYSTLDRSQTAVTDFDLLPVIGESYNIIPIRTKINDETGEINYTDPTILNYPWKFWYDNVGFSIESIIIADSGSGYISRPQVRINGGFGTGAVAKAYIANGKLSRIDLVSKGSGFLKAPEIVIDGGLAEGGTQARASAIIGNSVVRSNKISIKFDRITRTYYVTELTETETFVGTGSRKQFPLKFSPDTNFGKSTVTINGVDALKNDYELSSRKSVSRGYTSYSGALTFVDAPITGDQIEITYTKDFNHLSAADRINFYYNPQTGQLGRDLSQLMQGIDFGGVNITGLGFTVGGGWDSLPWFTDGWDGFDAEFDDYVITVNDSSFTYQLPYIPANGQQINIYHNGKRIDDLYFSQYDGVTIQPNGKKVPPAGTIMDTWVGDGVSDVIQIPDGGTFDIDIKTGDKIVFRKNTSDGSRPIDPNEYDTQLSGGNLAYTTATGFAPDDVILDGEGFITPAHSHAPEEIVPGHISDAVAIKVFRLPRSGGSTIFFRNYICDGVQTEFSFEQFPNSASSVFVKVGNLVLTEWVDYYIDHSSRSIKMLISPAIDTALTVISFGFASESVLDLGVVVSDGSTIEFITNAPWPSLVTDDTELQANERLNGVVLLNGESVDFELFKTGDNSSTPNRVSLRLAQSPGPNQSISYIITADNNYSLSTVYDYQVPVDGFATSFQLPENTVGLSQPFENNVIALRNGKVLTPAITTNFTMTDNQLVYNIPPTKSEAFVINPSQFFVYRDGEQLLGGVDYIFSSGFLTITVTKEKYKEGALLTLVDYQQSEYFFIGTEIGFTFQPLVNDNIRVISFYNHNVEKIVRSVERFDLTSTIVPGSPTYYAYQSLRGGEIRLFRTVSRDDYVWVIKNQRLLSHSIDYYLDDDYRTVRLSDPIQDYTIQAQTVSSVISAGVFVINIDDPSLITDLIVGARVTTEISEQYFSAGTFVTAISGSSVTVSIPTSNAIPGNTNIIFTGTDKLEIIIFNDKTVNLGYGYMQFKDMLNRVHYKRIRKSKSTKLSVNLRQKDTEIYVEDGSVLSLPNPSRNLPGIIEINGERIEYFSLNDNVLSQLRRGTLGTGSPTIHRTGSYIIDIGPSETIPYNDQHIVETFVGDGSSREFDLNYTPAKSDIDQWFTEFGYRLKGEYNSLESYIPKDVVIYNYTYYKNISACKGILPTNSSYWELHISIPSTYRQSNELDVFVGGYRLKKVPYNLFEESNNYPYSPEGNTQKEAEFSVNGENRVRLTSGAPENSKVVVIKKIGRVWEDADIPEKIFRNVRANIGDATFDVTKVNTQYSVSLINAGTVYNKGDVITISGATVGGVSPDNDIQITVTNNLVTRGTNLAPRIRIYPGEGISSAGFFTIGESYVIEFIGATDFTLIGATSNTIGTIFVATGSGTGNGTAFKLIGSANPNEQVFTMASGFPSILWYNAWFIGNGGSGYVTALDSGLGQTFTVTFETSMDSLQSIAGGDWFIRRNKDPIQSIVEYSFAGVGQTDGFIAKSLVDSNNPIADFLKNTETVFPTYVSTEEEPAAVSFDNSQFTMDDPTDTFDQG
jgi:ribosomal protein S17E